MVFCHSIFHKTYFILHKWIYKNNKKKREKTPSAETLFLHQLRLFPGYYSIIHSIYLYSSLEGVSWVTSILLGLVSQIIQFFRKLMDLFDWKQQPCPVLHTFSQDFEKKQYCNIDANLVFCALFMHLGNMPLQSRHMMLIQLFLM